MVLSRNLYFAEQKPSNSPMPSPDATLTRLVNAGVLPPMNMPSPTLSKNQENTRSSFGPMKARPSRKNRKNRKSTRKNSRR